MRAITVLKVAASLALNAATVSGKFQFPLSVLLGTASVGVFIWGLLDLLDSIRIERTNAMRGSKSSEEFNRRAKRLLVLSLAVFFACITVLGFSVVWYHGEVDTLREQTHYVKVWGVKPPNLFWLTLDGSRLQEYSKTHRAMVACRRPDAAKDFLQDSKLDKSTSFEIHNSDFSIELTLVHALTRPFDCVPTLLPSGMSPDQVATLGQVRDRGGILLQHVSMATGSVVP